jgi:hypothetical protein
MSKINMTYPASCPKCEADLDGGEIPEKDRQFYSPPYRFGRVIAVIEDDRFSRWKCPDCQHQWR